MGNSVGIVQSGCPCFSNSEIQAEELHVEPAENVSIEKTIPALSLITITPRRQDNLLQCVPQTPSGDRFVQFPYYCPLCMEHFKDILVTACCNHYICFPCCITYLQSKQMMVSYNYIIIYFIFLSICE